MKFERLAKRYRGSRAKDYERQRSRGSMWPREQEAVAEFLGEVPPGSSVLDIPVGTGRFLPLYKKFRLRPTGLDISSDMLTQAAKRARAENLEADLHVGDIREIAAPNRSFDCSVCNRFFNWLDFAEVAAAFSELNRVTRTFLIVGIRCRGTELSRASARQWLHSLRRRIRRGGLVVHDRTKIEGLFADHGWKVEAVCGVNTREDGSEYLIYLLKRARA